MKQASSGNASHDGNKKETKVRSRSGVKRLCQGTTEEEAKKARNIVTSVAQKLDNRKGKQEKGREGKGREAKGETERNEGDGDCLVLLFFVFTPSVSLQLVWLQQ